jgi:hypothetical protein
MLSSVSNLWVEELHRAMISSDLGAAIKAMEWVMEASALYVVYAMICRTQCFHR